ncbi:MAG: CGNR zinc finger domain-containing protein [Kouleothrix sp.]
MKEFNTHAGNVRLVGGRLCLDFVNAAVFDGRVLAKEYWHDYAAFTVWLRHAGALDAAAIERAAVAAAERPADAAAALARAIELRGALFGLFGSAAAAHAPAAGDIAVLNAALVGMPQPVALAEQGGRLGWRWPAGTAALDLPIWPVLWSAVGLLVAPELADVRMCAGPGCSWLFLDTSRNHTRRWCSMADCGNVAKARRHYAQHRR